MKPRKARARPRFSMYLVNRPRPPEPAVSQVYPSGAQRFEADGWIYPRRSDQEFDIGIRVSAIAAATTAEQVILQDQSLTKGGLIRRLGYSFSQPHAYLQVRTTLLINGSPPIDYLFRTVDATTPTTFQGSFPPFQIGSPEAPTEVFIKLPANAKITMRFQNASLNEAFSGWVRLYGWLLGE